MKRRTVLMVAGLVLVGLAGLGVLVATTSDYSRYRGLIETAVKARTGRNLTIAGKLKLELGSVPALSARDVSLANAAWGSRPEMVRVNRLKIEVKLLPLLRGDLEIVRVLLIEPDILLETDVHDQGNWVFGTLTAGGTLGAPAPPAPREIGPFKLPQVSILALRDAHLTYRNGTTGRTTTLTLARADLKEAGPEARLAIDGEGEIDGIAFKASGEAGALAALGRPGTAFPLDLTGEVANVVKAEVHGTVAEPLAVKGFTLGIKAKIGEIERFAALLHRAAPLSGPAMLTAQLSDAGPDRFIFKSAHLGLGRNDLAGDLTLDLAGNRPALSGTLASTAIDLATLLPDDKTKTGWRHNPGHVLPAEPIAFDGLGLADLDLHYRAQTLRLSDGLAITNLGVALRLNAGELALHELTLDIAGGRVAGEIGLSGRSKGVTARLTARGLKLAALDAALLHRGLVNGSAADLDADLRAAGTSTTAWAASLNGNLAIDVGPGQFASGFADLLGLGGLIALIDRSIPSHETTQLNCAVGGFTIRNGVATPRAFVVDTANLTLDGSGTIDLASERVSLLVDTSTKIPNLLSVLPPIQVGGTLADPTFSPAVITGAANTVGRVVGGALSVPGKVFDVLSTPFSGTAPHHHTTTCGEARAHAGIR